MHVWRGGLFEPKRVQCMMEVGREVVLSLLDSRSVLHVVLYRFDIESSAEFVLDVVVFSIASLLE